MVYRLGSFCHYETVVRQVWVEDASLQGCEAAWWVFSDVSKEHSPSSSGTTKFFLDSPLKTKAAQARITGNQSSTDTASHDIELGFSAVPL